MKASYVRCSHCHEDFLKDDRHIKENLKLGAQFYCSRHCFDQARTQNFDLICELPGCQKKFKRIASAISLHNFCSHRCSAIYSNHLRFRKRPKKHCPICNKVVKINKTYCSVQCWAKDHQLPEAVLLSGIKLLADKLGRSPTRRECPQFSACVRRFGSWNNALVRADLQPNRSLNQRMYKRRVCFARDGHRCNSVSELIVDNWLFSHSIPHQKETPYPMGKLVADWTVGNDIYVEYFGLAKDSKRYDAEIERKRRICTEKGIELIEIYPKDLFPKEKLSKIFDSFAKK